MKREVRIRTFIIAMIILAVAEIILLFVFSPKNKNENYSSEYCKEAVCNEDASLCYAYDLDSEGNTVVVWRGSCQNGN